MFVQRMRIISDWIMCSMSESDDVGNKAEEGAWKEQCRVLNSRLQMDSLSFYFYSRTDLECGTQDPPL